MPADYVELDLGPRELDVERRADGTIVISLVEELADYPVKMTDCLFATAAEHPDRVLLAQRVEGGEWRRVTYGEAASSVRSIGAALLEYDLGAERPIMILSGASIEHALLTFAALHVGIPVAPVTPAYSLLSQDLAKLKHVTGLLTPGLVFAQDAKAFARAIDILPADCAVVAAGADGEGRARSFADLEKTEANDAARKAAEAVKADDIAKFLFTSGSTSMPKAVAITHRMWCANQQMFLQAMPFMGAEPPVLVDWLPWHHVSGGNQVIGMVLYLGGSLYIDEGKPTREHIGETVRNLKEIQPTACFSAPKGFAELLPYFRADREFARRFFSSISMFFYSGASLPATLLTEMDAMSEATIGKRVPVLSAYGATETAPFSLIANWVSERSGLAGLPMAGITAKLVPLDGKYELGLKGPNVTPGYWRAPDKTKAAFDEEGFLKLGDTVSLVDPDDLAQGLAFEGRLAEDFKLTTGTWVNVGGLRDRFMKEAGLAVRDIVVTGEGRDTIGALIFMAAQDSNDLIGDGSEHDLADLAAHPAILAHYQGVLDRLAAGATGSSTFIERALIIPEEPDPQAGELTDKGSISQRNVLTNRKALVEKLYDAPQAIGALLAKQP